MIAPTPVRVVVVDDHEVVASALVGLLQTQADLAVAGYAGTVADAVALVAHVRPDVVLADHRLPDGTGVDLAARIRSDAVGAAVLILTADPTVDVVDAALDAGCSGVLGKGASVEELLGALRTVAAGGTHYHREVLEVVRVRRDAARPGGERLSAREREVLQLVARGLTTAHIAAHLDLSHHTVRNHLRRALARLGAHSKLDAVMRAVHRGEIIIEPEPS